jgi:signal transduction histidine kinase
MAATAILGFNSNTIAVILGPGILLIMLLSFIFFIEQVKEVIQYGKTAGKALMASSTLFFYGCFFIIYLFWYVYKTPDVENAFLVYFFVVTLSSMLASLGLIIEKKRLTILDELKITQNELSRLYPNEKIVFPKETARSLEDDNQF